MTLSPGHPYNIWRTWPLIWDVICTMEGHSPSIPLTIYHYIYFVHFYSLILLSQISRIRDPVADSTYKDLWLATARVRIIILC